MDDEYRAQLTEQLRALRRLQHTDQMMLARMGISADPSITLRVEDREREIAQIESRLGIQHPMPTRQLEPEPQPRRVYEQQVAQRQERARQADVDHHMKLLATHRANLAHYRAQAKAFGGIDLAPPITRHGMNEARAGIAQAKRNLEALGVTIDNLPGDE